MPRRNATSGPRRRNWQATAIRSQWVILAKTSTGRSDLVAGASARFEMGESVPRIAAVSRSAMGVFLRHIRHPKAPRVAPGDRRGRGISRRRPDSGGARPRLGLAQACRRLFRRTHRPPMSFPRSLPRLCEDRFKKLGANIQPVSSVHGQAIASLPGHPDRARTTSRGPTPLRCSCRPGRAWPASCAVLQMEHVDDLQLRLGHAGRREWLGTFPWSWVVPLRRLSSFEHLGISFAGQVHRLPSASQPSWRRGSRDPARADDRLRIRLDRR